ncbi:hypothetical protein AVEN_248977-1 [Araneus ventricosus]|uniref:Transposase Tc1-like domain-containing protein n=1 Tax=Araneus ventricosus TaxID=182803 RepID=A0A4Y2VSD7_ARAVE|nr:hypothetical protein AVEN_248977-1 [Araneus ventricosus]
MPSVVCNLRKQFQNTGSIERKLKVVQEPPRPQKHLYLSIIARRKRGATASQLSRDLYAATRTRVYKGDCFQKRLHETGLFARRPKVCVLIYFYEQRVLFSMLVQRA